MGILRAWKSLSEPCGKTSSPAVYGPGWTDVSSKTSTSYIAKGKKQQVMATVLKGLSFHITTTTIHAQTTKAMRRMRWPEEMVKISISERLSKPDEERIGRIFTRADLEL